MLRRVCRSRVFVVFVFFALLALGSFVFQLSYISELASLHDFSLHLTHSKDGQMVDRGHETAAASETRKTPPAQPGKSASPPVAPTKKTGTDAKPPPAKPSEQKKPTGKSSNTKPEPAEKPSGNHGGVKRLSWSIIKETHPDIHNPVPSDRRHIPNRGHSDLNEIELRFRRSKVRKAMLHAWNSYEKYAWGADEVHPLTKTSKSWMGNGCGATIIDSLDTLWIMNLKNEYRKARDWVKNSFDFRKMGNISVFEATIRVVGGLLSAFSFSGEKVFLEKARAVGDFFTERFNKGTGYAPAYIDLGSGASSNERWVPGGGYLFTQVGSLQLEYRELSYATGDPKYAKLMDRSMKTIKDHFPQDCLPGKYINPNSLGFYDVTTIGSMADSSFEYLLKQVVQMHALPSVANPIREMYECFVDNLARHMVRTTNGPLKLTYVAERRGGLDHRMDELACYFPGVLALGALHKMQNLESAPEGAEKARARAGRDLLLAHELGRTCYQAWRTSPSGIAPEIFRFSPGYGQNDFAPPADSSYLLRPETIESLFVLYRVTGDQIYREWAWDLFQAIEARCRVDGGYSGLLNTQTASPGHNNEQPSYYLAETLKYFYLIFAEDSVVPLDQWIFNTEAHPLPIHRDWKPY